MLSRQRIVGTRRVFPGCPRISCSGRERLFLYVLFLPVWTKHQTPERPSCDEFNLGIPPVFDCWYPTPHDLVPKSKVSTLSFSFRLSGRLIIVTVGLVLQMSGHAWAGCKDVSTHKMQGLVSVYVRTGCWAIWPWTWLAYSSHLFCFCLESRSTYYSHSRLLISNVVHACWYRIRNG